MTIQSYHDRQETASHLIMQFQALKAYPEQAQTDFVKKKAVTFKTARILMKLNTVGPLSA